MRVLMVAAAHPLPADDGLRLHLRHVLETLRHRHDIALLSLALPADDTSDAAMAQLCQEYIGISWQPSNRWGRLRDELLALPARRPLLVQQMRAAGLAETAIAVAQRWRPDVVHVEPGWAAETAAAVRWPTVLATLDAWHLNWRAGAREADRWVQRMTESRETARMRRFESRAYAAADAVVVVSEDDAAVLRRLDPRIDPVVVTNGVDLGHFARPPGQERQGRHVVLLTGAMHYPPNVDAARFLVQEVLPELQRKVGTASVVIAGRYPAPAVQALAGPHVEVTGTVPDLRPYLWAADAYVCPMRTGTGVKNKLLEALAAGCPSVVTTRAAAGLSLRDGKHVFIRDDAAAIASSLAIVLTDPAVADALATGGAARAASLSWEATADGFEAVYERAIRRGAGRRP